jgi:predicted small lipoprotein YifL
MNLINSLALMSLLSLAACGPSGNKALQDANASTSQVANTLDDISKTIRTVQETANQVKAFSEDMAVTGERVKSIQGVELLGSSQWEYRVVEAGNEDGLESELNQLGQKNWELVGVIARKGKERFVFKRPKK